MREVWGTGGTADVADALAAVIEALVLGLVDREVGGLRGVPRFLQQGDDSCVAGGIRSVNSSARSPNPGFPSPNICNQH